MRHPEQVRVLKLLMSRLDNGLNVDAGGVRRVPVDIYTAPERADLEWRTLFRGHPQLVALSGDLPEPGDFVTRDEFGAPMLVVRGEDGQVRAFANVCRHRGAVVEPSPRGRRRLFTCPFHGWTYDGLGRLAAVPKREHFGDVDFACLGLPQLPAAERHGLIWVHPEPGGALDPAALLDGLDDEFASWDFGRLVHAGDDSYATDMNWKLAIDTFGETYHFETLHRSTLAANFHGNVQTYDTYGRNHRMGLCLRSIDSLRGAPEAEWRIADGVFTVYYLFPNVQLNVGANSIILVRVYPVPGAPGRSVSKISFYVPPELADAERALALPQGFARIIRDEDYVAAAAAQRGAGSGLIQEFLFGRNEPALHHYHTTYHAALGLPEIPLEPA